MDSEHDLNDFDALGPCRVLYMFHTKSYYSHLYTIQQISTPRLDRSV